MAEISSGTLSRDDSVTAPGTYRLLWRAKLAPLGLKTNSSNLASSHFSPRFAYDLVTFLDDKVILASFPVYEGRNPPARRIFRVILLDANTGMILGTRQWEALQRELGMQTTYAGKFIVRTRQEMELYSQAFEKLAEYPLPDTRRPVWEDWEVYATPNRKHLVVAHFLDRDLTLDWLDSETLVSQRRWHAPSGEFGLGADKDKDKIHDTSNKRIVAVQKERKVEEYGAFAADDCHVFVGDGDRPLRKILERPRSCPVGGAAGSQWVNEEVLFLPTLQGVLFFDAEGRELLTESLEKNELAYHGRSSLDGRWFVVPIVQSKGGFDLLDIGPHLVLKRLQIYEIRDELRVLRHADAKVNTKNVVSFALSPDGTRLAVIRRSDIELYAAQGPR